jgi:hypothetical protein
MPGSYLQEQYSGQKYLITGLICGLSCIAESPSEKNMDIYGAALKLSNVVPDESEIVIESP